MVNIDYKDTNIEMIEKWTTDLNKIFIFEISENIHLLEKTKIVKNNILNTLEVAHNIVLLSQDKEIFDASQSKKNIEEELAKIRKDVVSIAVFGQMGSGKSSFLNSLIGEDLLIVSQSKATATITVVRHIENFNGYENGDIEICYKEENEILLNIEKALNELDNYFSNEESFSSFFTKNIEEFLIKKEQLLQKLEDIAFGELSSSLRKTAISLCDLLEYFIKGFDENAKNIGKTIISNSIENDMLTSESKSIFISKIIFYKDIELLKNIELIDTPGLGSNSQLDTRKSEEFISKADIVMILTEAVEPMQKDSETDILFILQDIQSKENNKDFFDKVFIIVNKIDDNEELNRDQIKELLKKSIKKAKMKVPDKNIMLVSASYEFQKKFSKEGLNNLIFKNKDNIGKDDLELIEKTIYDFSAAESTSKFLNENIAQIEKMFNNADENFANNIKKLDNSIEITETNIKKFKSEKESMRKELEKELHKIIIDVYRDIKSASFKKKDYILKEKECKFTIDRTIGSPLKGKTYSEKTNGILDYDYAYYKAISEKTLKNALYGNKDKGKTLYYTKLGKIFIDIIIKTANGEIQQEVNKILNIGAPRIKNKLMNKSKEIQDKYANKYGVEISLTNIYIKHIEIKLSDNIDLTRGAFRQIYQTFSILAWGTEMKYTETIAREWEKYAKNDYINAIEEEIENELNCSKNEVDNEVDNEIDNILETIENQLNQELKDKENYNNDKEKTNKDKVTIQNAFKSLNSDFISHAKEQNINLFK